MPKNIPYKEIHARIVRKYGRFIKCSDRRRSELALDIIEVTEDFERLYPYFQKIVQGKLPPARCYKTFLLMYAWSLHLSDHLKSIFKILSEGELDERGRQPTKKVEKRKSKNKNSSKV